MDDYKITDPADQAVTPGPINRHPGPFIREEIKTSFGLGVSALARALGLNRPHLFHVLNGEAPLSRDLAYKIEALTGLPADLLIAMQAAYDRVQEMPLRQKYQAEIQRLEPKA